MIAIVSDAWEDARDHATDMFWRGRLSFLSETRLVNTSSEQMRFLSWIDAAQTISLADPTFTWSKDSPYCLVKGKECYDNPDTYLSSHDADEIKKVQSFKSDLYWLKASKKEKTSFFEQQLNITQLVFKWLGHSTVYLGLLVLGSFTFGFFWPQPFRMWLLAFGNRSEDDESCESEQIKELQLLRKEVTQMMDTMKASENRENTNASIEIASTSISGEA